MSEYLVEEYRNMSPHEHPFGNSAMSVEEIEINYRDALKPKESIQIIAELCATKASEIRKLLEARGKIVSGYDRAAIIEKRLAEGTPVGKIIEELRISRHAFYEFCKSRDIRLPKQSAAGRTDQIHKYSEEGLNGQEIAFMLGISSQALYAYCNKNNIKLRELTKKKENSPKVAENTKAVEPAEETAVSEEPVPVSPAVHDESDADSQAAKAIVKIIKSRISVHDKVQQFLGVLNLMEELEGAKSDA